MRLKRAWQSAGGLLICTAWLILSGCGSARPATAPLSGTVTLDGQPIEGAALVFTPINGGRPAQAVADAAGYFEAWTFERGDGALPGEHSVAVSLVTIVGAEATEDGLEGPTSGAIRIESLIPARYGNGSTSELSAIVDANESNSVDLALSSR